MVEDTLNEIVPTPCWKFWYIDHFRTSTKKVHLKANSLQLKFSVCLSFLNNKKVSNILMFRLNLPQKFKELRWGRGMRRRKKPKETGRKQK